MGNGVKHLSDERFPYAGGGMYLGMAAMSGIFFYGLLRMAQDYPLLALGATLIVGYGVIVALHEAQVDERRD